MIRGAGTVLGAGAERGRGTFRPGGRGAAGSRAPDCSSKTVVSQLLGDFLPQRPERGRRRPAGGSASVPLPRSGLGKLPGVGALHEWDGGFGGAAAADLRGTVSWPHRREPLGTTVRPSRGVRRGTGGAAAVENGAGMGGPWRPCWGLGFLS